MKPVTAAAASVEFSELLRRAAQGKERLRIVENGQALAAVVPSEDLELLEELEDQIDREDARAALEEAKAGGAMILDEFKASHGNADDAQADA